MEREPQTPPPSPSSLHGRSREGFPPSGSYPYPVDPRSGVPLALPAYPMGPGVYPPAMMPAYTEPGKVMDPVTLLMALKRRWLLALTLGLCTGVMAAATVWLLWPPSGSLAMATLHIEQFEPSVFNPGLVPSVDFNIYRRTQRILIRNREVAEKTLNLPGIKDLQVIKASPDPVSYITGSLGAEFDQAPDMLSVYLAGPEEYQHELAPLLDAVIETYLTEIVRKQKTSKNKRLDILQEVMSGHTQHLQSDRETLAALNQALTVGSGRPELTGNELRVALNALHEAEGWLGRTQNEILELDVKRQDIEEQLKALNDTPLPQDAINRYIDKNPDVVALQEAVGEQDSLVQQSAAVLKDGKNHPLYIREESKLENLRRELEGLRDSLRDEAVSVLRQERQGGLENDAGLLEEKIRIRRRLKERLEANVAALRQKTEHVSDSSYEIDRLQKEIEATEAAAVDTQAQINAILTEMHAGDRVTRLDHAVAMGPSISRKQQLATWGAGLGAFGLVVFGISWWEFRARKINTVEEVARDLGLRVVGALPPLPDRRGARRLPGRDAFQPNYLIESVDTTRTMLLHAANREGLRTVMITSARSGEGKTSLSIQLAASLARAGRKTLFIDGDLRSPAAHQVFNLPFGPGLSEVLRGEAEAPATIQPTSIRNLWMMPAGRWTSHATEALSQEQAKPVLQQLREEFDFIIVDSSPVLAVVDALLLGQQVDAAIFSILHEVSHSPSVYAAHQRLESLGVRILGAVVNGVARHQLDYKSDYYYGSPASAPAAGPDTEELPHT